MYAKCQVSFDSAVFTRFTSPTFSRLSSVLAMTNSGLDTVCRFIIMKFLLRTAVLQILLFNGYKSEIISEETLNFKKSLIVEAVNQIIDKHFTTHCSDINIISLGNSSAEDHYMDSIQEVNSNIKFANENLKHPLRVRKNVRKASIIFTSTLLSFQKLYENLCNKKLFDRSGFYLIIYPSANDDQRKAVFDLLWKTHIFNVALLTHDKNFISLWTFFPFQEGCDNTKPKLINEFNNRNKVWKSISFFPDKFKNLNQCVIKVGTYENEPSVIRHFDDGKHPKIYGAEIDTIKQIGFLINFIPNFSFYVKDSGLVYDNGSSTGLMQKVMEGEVDVIIGYLSLQFIRAKFLSASTPFTFVPLAIVIPPGDLITPFRKLLYPFSLSVWYPFLAILVTAFIAITAAKNSSKKVYYFMVGHGITSPFMNLLGHCLGVSMKRLPQKNFARFTLMNLMIFFLVMRTCYQGILFNLLQSDVREKEVASIDEMIQKDFKFYIYNSLEKRSEGHAFYDKRVIINLDDLDNYRRKSLDPSFKGAVFSYITQVLYLNQINHKHFTYRICKETFLNNQMVFYFQKGFYLLEAFDKIMQSLHENGLIEFWTLKYIDSQYTNQKKISSGPTPLSVDNLLACLELWIGGVLLCFIVFCGELWSTYFEAFNKTTSQ